MIEENRFYGLAVLAMKVAAAVALLSALYLLYGIVFGHLDTATAPAMSNAASGATEDAARVAHNFSLASSALGLSLSLYALLAAFVYFTDTLVGYLLVIGAATIGFGIPYILAIFLPATAHPDLNNLPLKTALGSFPLASIFPGVIGMLMVGKDIVMRFGDLTTGREAFAGEMAYGSDAEKTAKQARPKKTRLLGKCWEGAYCRENIRPHCPVFQAKAACWRQKKGCYCEEDILRTAIQKIEGTLLPMAPDPKFNFSNASMMGVGRELPQHKRELSWSEKKERCRNCIIYNEHQREKYQVALPATMLATIGGFYLLLPIIRSSVETGLANGLAFFQNAIPASQAQAATQQANVGLATASPFAPDPALIWVLTISLGVVGLAKALTLLEWAIFEKKI